MMNIITNNFSHELIVDVLGMRIETIAEICNVNNYKDCNFYHKAKTLLLFL